MRTHGYLLSVATGVAIATTSSAPLWAQAPAALSGQVSSAGEGAMEGVLVSAKKAGATITITVVSDEQGRFSFPAAKLAPGHYTLSIRAIGYDLDGPHAVEIARRQAGDRRHQARQDQESRRAAHQRRVDHEHARHASSRSCRCSTA